MPAPIAISRTPSDVDSFGSPRSSYGLSSGSQMNGLTSLVGSGSFREAIAASFGKEASDIMDYSISRFSSSHASTDSDMTALPSTSFPRTKLETTFCRNFKCCGQGLENLHDLLQHYEEMHVKFEDEESAPPAMVADDDNSVSSSATSSQPPSPKTTNAAKTDATNDTFEESSAFDTAIMRSTANKGGKKRSFGQFSNGNNNANVHQSLRRALIDGGVARSSSKASSIYSANSPFSTPGSSLPGTPKLDADGETAFFGNGGNNIPAFSSLSIRGGAGEDHDLPSCAPPNLFFPSTGSSTNSTSTSIPPIKRERISSTNSATSSSALENSLASPGALGDRPYKCQSPGCDKAYKQMNGLKYHRLHGQCNQNNLPPQQQINAVVSEKAAATTTPAAATTTATTSTPASTTSLSPNTLSEATKAAVAAAVAKASASAPAAVAATAAASTSAVVAPISDPVDGISTPSPPSSAPGSPRSSSESLSGDSNSSKVDRAYICQVGACGKRYKNLNGLRYHYSHSGSHGLLGLQLLHTNGGGPSARADASTGRPAISTNDLSSAALAAAAQAAAAQQQANQRNAAMQQQQQQSNT